MLNLSGLNMTVDTKAHVIENKRITSSLTSLDKNKK